MLIDFDVLTLYKHTSTNCDKFLQVDNYTYIKNGNVVGTIQGYGFPILQKTPSTIQVGSEQLTNVYDFDVFDKTIYYVNNNQRNILKSATVGSDGTFVAGGSITFSGIDIKGVVCA